MQNFILKKMIIVITGGSKGIGKSICGNLLKKKYKIINVSRSNCSLKNVKNYKCDISNYLDVRETFKKIKKFDVLINNSGITEFNNNYIDTFNKIVDTNLKGAFYCSIEALKILKKRKNSSIINICSINAYQAFPDNPGYVSSKGGLLSLTRSLALDLAKFGIRVNSVGPGYFRTSMTKKSWNNLKKRKKIRESTILKRWGVPKDLEGIIVFLSSDSSEYITGQDIYVDGGWSAKGIR